MIVKNLSSNNYPINKSVQIDLNTIDPNDGYILAGQTLDLSKSITDIELAESLELKNGLLSGDLILVVEGEELTQSQSVEFYNSGPSEWAKTYNSEVNATNLRAGIAQGFIYAINCKIG